MTQRLEWSWVSQRTVILQGICNAIAANSLTGPRWDQPPTQVRTKARTVVNSIRRTPKTDPLRRPSI